MVRLSLVKTPHWILQGCDKPPAKLPGRARNFWSNWCLIAHAGVLAHDGETLVGFLRYDPPMPGYPMWALGTWVDTRYRGTGLAFKLWRKAIRQELPNTIHVGVVTAAGRRFAEKLVGLYPRISWELEVVR